MQPNNWPTDKVMAQRMPMITFLVVHGLKSRDELLLLEEVPHVKINRGQLEYPNE